jgi:hypothetical protein
MDFGIAGGDRGETGRGYALGARVHEPRAGARATTRLTSSLGVVSSNRDRACALPRRAGNDALQRIGPASLEGGPAAPPDLAGHGQGPAPPIRRRRRDEGAAGRGTTAAPSARTLRPHTAIVLALAAAGAAVLLLRAVPRLPAAVPVRRVEAGSVAVAGSLAGGVSTRLRAVAGRSARRRASDPHRSDSARARADATSSTPEPAAAFCAGQHGPRPRRAPLDGWLLRRGPGRT